MTIALLSVLLSLPSPGREAALRADALGAPGILVAVDGFNRVSGGCPLTGCTFTGTTTLGAGSKLNLLDDIQLVLGTGPDSKLLWSTPNTPDALVLTLGTDSRVLHIVENGDEATDWGIAQQTNPTLYIHSADQTSTTKWLSLAHNGTNGIITVGTGVLALTGTGGSNYSLTSGTIVGTTFESTGSAYFQAGNFQGSVRHYTDAQLSFGNSDQNRLYYNSVETPDALWLGLGSESRAFVIGDATRAATDYAHALQTNPTVYVHDNSTTTTHWISFAHDGTEGVVDSGTKILCMGNGAGACAGPLGALSTRLSSDPTGITSAVLASTTLSITPPVGTYLLDAHVMFNDSTAADGAQFDFGGGNATLVGGDLRADCVMDESGVLAQDSVTEITALTTVFSKTTLAGTGAAFVDCHGTVTIGVTGTFILRAAQVAHSTGTLTLRRGSFVLLTPVP